MSRISELRIKIKSLGSECTIIRKDEVRLKKAARAARDAEKSDVELVKSFWSLRGHRIDLKSETRCALLAFTFLRGFPYSSAEKVTRKPVPWDKIKRNAKSFGKDLFDQAAWDAWQKEGVEAHREGLKVLGTREETKRNRAQTKEQIPLAG